MSGDEQGIKPSVLLLASLPAARNPVFHMYIKGLRNDYKIVLGSSDPLHSAEVFPDVHCLPIAPPARKLRFWRRQARIVGTLNTHAGSQIYKPNQKLRNDKVISLLIHLIRHSFRHFLHYRKVQKPSLIVAIDGDLLMASRILARAWRIPYVYVVYEVFPNQFPWVPKEVSRALAIIEKWGIRGASKIIVADPVWVKLVARRYGVKRSRFAVVRTCPEIPMKCSSATVHLPLRIYYHGGFTPGRGLENLVLAMSDVNEAHLYLRGLGPLEATLHDLVRQKGLNNRVSFLEPVGVEKLAEAATEFDLGVTIACPSTANGRFLVGFKLSENMAAGLATVCSRSRPLGPLLNKYAIGITFSGCERNSIANALKYCVENLDSVSRWKKEARALAEKEFNANFQGSILRQVVSECIQGQR